MLHALRDEFMVRWWCCQQLSWECYFSYRVYTSNQLLVRPRVRGRRRRNLPSLPVGQLLSWGQHERRVPRWINDISRFECPDRLRVCAWIQRSRRRPVHSLRCWKVRDNRLQCQHGSGRRPKHWSRVLHRLWVTARVLHVLWNWRVLSPWRVRPPQRL